jgi:DNA-binding GntR family transcriptional regulator
VVPSLTLGRYIEIRRIRTLLEGLAAELAAENVTPADIAQLTAIQKKFETGRRKGDSAAAMQLNHDFHFGVYRLSRTDMLLSHIENLWVCMGPILKVYHEDIKTDYVTADEHSHLIEALKARDGKRVRASLERDIERGGEGIMRYIVALTEATPA